MADVHTVAQRTANMRAIRAKNTTPEIIVRRLLFARGFRFRIHVKTLAGSPDVVLAKHRVAIFVHGCFWHGHGCHLFKIPATRSEFWLAKIQANRVRDYRAEAELLAAGWRILIIWECSLKGRLKLKPEEIIDQAASWITAANSEVPMLVIRHA